MKHYTLLLFAALLLAGCKKDKEENNEPIEVQQLTFTAQHYSKKTSLPCKDNCPKVTIDVLIAEGPEVASDSINKKVFDVVRKIIFFGEQPYAANNYDDLMASFIKSYEELKNEYPREALGWEGYVNAFIAYRSDKVLNINLEHYTYTGGAHGYAGKRSLLFNPETGKSLTYSDIFKDEAGFTNFSEKQFRKKFKIPMGKSINATGLMFENDKFILPQNIFFTDEGLLLYYNPYEIASYAEQEKELLLPYSEIEQYLKVK
jgi:hypothetical protein